MLCILDQGPDRRLAPASFFLRSLRRCGGFFPRHSMANGGWSGQTANSFSFPPIPSTQCCSVDTSMSRRFSMRETVPWPTPMAMARSSCVCWVALRNALSVSTLTASTSMGRVLASTPLLFDFPLALSSVPFTDGTDAFWDVLGIRLPELVAIKIGRVRPESDLRKIAEGANVICFQVNMQTKAYSGRCPKKNRTSRPGQNGCSTLLNQSAYARHTIAQHYNIALRHTRLELNETVLALPHFHFQSFSGINRRGKAHIEANQTAGV